MWVTVIVKGNGSVTVRPDQPNESDKSYHAARAGAVFEHRVEIDDPKAGRVYDAIGAHVQALMSALDSAPDGPRERR